MPGFDRPQQDVELERAELEAILASKLFTRASSLAKLLSYICGKYFNGTVEQIKEYTIAVEFFKKEEDFDSKDSPIVRVEAGRLRAKLKEYYRTEGKNHTVRLVIPSGHYAPVFEHRRTNGTAETIEKNRGDEDESKDAILEQYGSDIGILDEENRIDEVPRAGIGPTPPTAPSRSRRGIYIAAFSAVGLGLIIAAVFFPPRVFHRSPGISDLASPSSSLPLAVPVVPEGPELRIMAGSTVARYVDQFGRVWVGDRYYDGGEILTPSTAAIQRAEDSPFCKQAREGDFEYAVPLNPGVYELHLYFAEMQYGFEPDEGGETSRIFHVFANDINLLDSVDVYSDAGGGGKVYERVFTDISPSQDGRLHLSFRSSAKGKAIVNGLEILPGIRGRMRPFRITTRASAYLSADQQLWEPDRYFRGGRTVIRLRPVEATRDPELYQSERYGNFMYAIPVAQGQYRLTLKFAETYFGTPNPLHVGPKNRLFDVYCNGQTLLKNFDIAKEAGGLNRSLDKTFHGLRPNAQGKLVLSFVPVVNYACVNAIEIAPE